MSNKSNPIPPAMLEYLRDPVPEDYTAELLEDLHAVIDDQRIELARALGSRQSDEAIIKAWEAELHQQVESRRQEIEHDHGAQLPYAFVASEIKMEDLLRAGHPEYQSGAVPDSVVEIMQEFLEVVTYRDELGG